MRRVWFIVWIITVSYLSSAVLADDVPMKLELESSIRTLRLSQQTEVWLKIVSPSVHAIVAGTEGVSPSGMKPSAFVYTFDFKPTHEGEYTLGPYSLTFNGQTLTSNITKIHVLPQWDGHYGARFHVDKTTMALGEDVELLFEFWEKSPDYKSLSLKRSEAFIGTERGMKSNMTQNGGQMVVYMTRSWLITPKNRGPFHINKDIFSDFPTGIEPPDLVVEVK